VATSARVRFPPYYFTYLRRLIAVSDCPASEFDDSRAPPCSEGLYGCIACPLQNTGQDALDGTITVITNIRTVRVRIPMHQKFRGNLTTLSVRYGF